MLNVIEGINTSHCIGGAHIVVTSCKAWTIVMNDCPSQIFVAQSIKLKLKSTRCNNITTGFIRNVHITQIGWRAFWLSCLSFDALSIHGPRFYTLKSVDKFGGVRSRKQRWYRRQLFERISGVHILVLNVDARTVILLCILYRWWVSDRKSLRNIILI